MAITVMIGEWITFSQGMSNVATGQHPADHQQIDNAVTTDGSSMLEHDFAELFF